jgi:hypothetical protein
MNPNDNSAPAVPPQPPVNPAPVPPVQNPAPAPAASAGGSAAPGYISNPFALVMPSWNAVKRNLWTLIAPGLIIAVLAVVLGLVIGFSAAKLGSGGVIGLLLLGLVVLVAVLVLLPYSTIVMLASAKGEKISISEAAKRSPQYALRVLGAAILTALAVVGGLILLVVPGLIFAAWFSLASYLIVNENLGAIEAMKRSKELVKGHTIEMLGLISFATALGVLQIIPILGTLAVWAISIMFAAAPALRYLQLKELKSTNAPAPTVHWGNYAVIVLALISLPINMSQQRTPSEADDYQKQLQEQLESAVEESSLPAEP